MQSARRTQSAPGQHPPASRGNGRLRRSRRRQRHGERLEAPRARREPDRISRGRRVLDTTTQKVPDFRTRGLYYRSVMSEAVAPASGHRPVVLVIADISGYTRFMVSHRKALSHAQIIVASLLGAIREALEPALTMCQLEGDAVFLFAAKDGPTPEVVRAQELGARIANAFRVFAQVLSDAGASVICKCEACSVIDKLRLKVVVHSGEGVIEPSRGTVAGALAVNGVDVIIAHRLLKNSVTASEYLLVTESARPDLAFDRPVAFSEGVEEYDEIGEIRTFVAAPAELTGGGAPATPRPSLTHPT